LSPTGFHDEFLELCSLSSSGELSEGEQKRLEEHLAHCASCREAKLQFESIVDHAIPAFAAESPTEQLRPDSSWSQEAAEAEFFQRLAREGKKSELDTDVRTNRRSGPAPQIAVDTAWRQARALYAAGILLFSSLGFGAYELGIHRHVASAAPATAPPVGPTWSSLQEQLSDASHERETARVQIAQRGKIIADLRRRLEQQSLELSQMRVALEASKTDQALRKSGSDRERQAELAQKLGAVQSEAQLLRAKLASLEEQSSRDAGRAEALESKVHDLTGLLQEKETEVAQQQQLLAHDRDIRELMGARDLYMTEVYDVARSGETQKPFGRVFYTKEKSLIFYAYDLDQQAGLKNASTFQAWGRRGPDRSQALNLGIFYEDNVSRKRWVLKFNEPKTLAQIDAVFVTVEPNGGSRKPSGKSLLFAYLKVDPNHP